MKKRITKEFFCDECNASSKRNKIYRKRNYPFGRKSKPVISNLCYNCKSPKETKRANKMLSEIIKNDN